MIVLGIAVALLNLAYVRLFQQDINLSYVPLMVTGGMTLLLALVGMLYFQETINMQSAIGMVVILAGL